MKKIGIFSGYYIPHLGGVERYVDKLSPALEKLGYKVVIITSNHNDLPPVEKINGRTIYRLPIRKLAKDRYPIPQPNAEYRELIGRIEAEKIDYYIVNTRFHLNSLVGAKMGKCAGKPVMLIEHGTGHFTVNNHVLDYFGKLYEHVLSSRIKKYVDKFYGVSQNCNIWLKHFGIEASGVFYNAIDAADEKKVKDYYSASWPNEVVIAYAGRLIKEKGILNLLEAFMELNKTNPNLKARLVVAGDGDLLSAIKEKYQDPRVEILGRLDFEHVMALYKRSDIFVYPSLYPEGLPTSILEAGLMGCAIVATPRGGTEEVIIDRGHGIIVDGSIGSLHEAILELITNPDERTKLAGAVKQRIETVFDWGAVAEQVDKEIKSFNAG